MKAMEKKKMKIYKRINQFEHIFFLFFLRFFHDKMCVCFPSNSNQFSTEKQIEKDEEDAQGAISNAKRLFSLLQLPILSIGWMKGRALCLLGICMTVVLSSPIQDILKDSNKYTEFLIQQKIPKINNLIRL